MQNILIMGSGAVGGFYGAQLASVDRFHVTFVARGAHLKAMQGRGFFMMVDFWFRGKLCIISWKDTKAKIEKNLC